MSKIRRWLQTTHGLPDGHPVWLVRNEHDRVAMRQPDTTLGELWELVQSREAAHLLARAALKRLMEDLSEDYYCAGWLHGWELVCWNQMHSTERTPHPSMDFTDDEVAELRRLHELSGGWWVWDDAADDLKFVTASEWSAARAAG